MGISTWIQNTIGLHFISVSSGPNTYVHRVLYHEYIYMGIRYYVPTVVNMIRYNRISYQCVYVHGLLAAY